MKFLKRSHNGTWHFIDIETLLREVTNEQLDMMIWFKATIRIDAYQYRRYIPGIIRDWAIIIS